MNNLRKIRILVLFFIVSLIVSGVTAIPLETELRLLVRIVNHGSRLEAFLSRIYKAIVFVKSNQPFLLYGYDWLAFAHFVIAILFIGPYRDPVKNKWVIEFGLIACALIIPFALIVGHFREIPFYWRLIDCAFGLLGAIPLLYILKHIKKIEKS